MVAASVTGWARRVPWTLISRVGLAFTALVFIFQLPFFFAPGTDTVLPELEQLLFTFAWLLLVTAFTRTVSLLTLVAFWFFGVYPAIALALLVAEPVVRSAGVGSPLVADVWVPLTEEAIKVLPLVLFFVLAARRNQGQPSASDGLLLGFAVGAGFAFHEDVMFARIGGDGWGSAAPWSTLFPSMHLVGTGASLGHPGWVALMGLSLGLASLYRDRHWSRALPAVTFVLVVLDHMASNAAGGEEFPGSSLLSALYPLEIHGWLLVYILAGGVVAAVALDWRILRWAARRDAWFPSIPLNGFLQQVGLPATWPSIVRWQAFGEYLRDRRALYYAIWRWQRSRVPAQVPDAMVRLVFSRGLEAGLRR